MVRAKLACMERITGAVGSQEALIRAVGEGARIRYLHFWGHRPRPDGRIGASCLSQWWPAPFTVDGVAYATAEHWMMAGKARLFGDAAAERAARERFVRLGRVTEHGMRLIIAKIAAGDGAWGEAMITRLAEILQRDGDLDTAARLYVQAAAAAPNLAERDHLVREAARLRQLLRR